MERLGLIGEGRFSTGCPLGDQTRTCDLLVLSFRFSPKSGHHFRQAARPRSARSRHEIYGFYEVANWQMPGSAFMIAASTTLAVRAQSGRSWLRSTV